MSSQLRMVIDRFRAIDIPLARSGKQTLLLAGASVVPTVFDSAVATFRETARYLGCRERDDMERTNSPKRAFAMGRSLEPAPIRAPGAHARLLFRLLTLADQAGHKPPAKGATVHGLLLLMPVPVQPDPASRGSRRLRPAAAVPCE